ncbi:MAG TPA: tetratricopeptide repeat protein [Gemmataceae bacterium]|nr:tetratricopeptide repeat protein [Gemmataceae bacterium]
MEHNNPRGLVTVGTLLGMLAIAGGSTGLTVWAMKAGGPAQEAVQQAKAEAEKARKAEADAKRQTEEALTAVKEATKELNEARASEKKVQTSERIDQEVLTFLRTNVLAGGSRGFWVSEGPGKDVKLKQAVDAAEAKVAKTYSDKPLVEASIREILGLTYLELGEAKKAVSQLERALVLLEAELGSDDKATGECKNSLARAYRAANQPDKAGQLYDQFNRNNKIRQTPRGQKPVRG